MRRTEASPSGSSAIRSLIFAAALSVSETRFSGLSVISIGAHRSSVDRLSESPSGAFRNAEFVTAVSRLVEPFSSPLVASPALLTSGSPYAGGTRARQLVALPDLWVLRARDSGLDDGHVLRVRDASAPPLQGTSVGVRVRCLRGTARAEPVHDQLLPDGDALHRL